MKMKMKKFLKKSTIFELTTLKLAYVSIFMKIWEKCFGVIFTNQGKNENEDEKIQKTSTIFELSTPKLGKLKLFKKI